MSFKERLSQLADASPENIPGGYQQIGDIVLVKFPKGTALPAKKKTAQGLLSLLTYTNTVCEISGVSGEFRKPLIKVLASRTKKPNLITVHRESGILYKLDVSKIMFSKGNLSERARLIPKIAPGEMIIDMFAGIGYFSLGLAKFSPAEKIISIEKNPVAFKYLKENIGMNKAEKIKPVKGDCRRAAARLAGKADRIIMGYFPGTEKFLPAAFCMLKPRGIIHYHNIYPEQEMRSKPTSELEEAAKRAGYCIVGIAHHVVKSYRPSVYHVVADAEVEKIRAERKKEAGNTEARDFYDRTADIYDARQANPWTARLRQAEIRLIADNCSGSVLDIGCGTGFHLAWLQNNKGAWTDITGCDISKKMLSGASENVSCKLVECQAERLPFEDNKFGTVLCLHASLNLFDWQKALAEMHRVLKSGGKVILSVASVWDNYGKREKRVRIEGSILRMHLFDSEELRAEARRAGFEVAGLSSIFRSDKPRWGDWSSKVTEDFSKPLERGAMYLCILQKKCPPSRNSRNR